MPASSDSCPASVQILDASTAAVVREIAVKAVIDIAFSPRGTQLQTWERQGERDSARSVTSSTRLTAVTPIL